MYRVIISGFVAFATLTGAATLAGGIPAADADLMAQDRSPEEAFRIATESGICGDAGVAAAIFNAESIVEATCNDATAFLPLAGGLAPLLGLGAGVLALAATAGGSATPDTQ